MSGFDVDHPVHFTRSAPFDANPGQLVFFDVIESDVLSRSSVLSCVAEAGGEAKLPDSVTVADFKKWLAAASDSEAGLQSRPLDFICVAIKVADAVDDKHIDEWIDIAAANLRQTVSFTSSDHIQNNVTDGLSVLTEHLKRRVFEAAIASDCDVRRFLSLFPAQLHASVIAASITPERVLSIRHGDASQKALKAMQFLPARPPSVLSLELGDTRQVERAAGWPELFDCLSHALHHHTGLTSLLLRACFVRDASPQLLFPAIATATALQSLRIEDWYSMPAEHVPYLKQALGALPRLHDLQLHLMEAAVPSTIAPKRAAELPAPPQICLADLLSPATALTSLSFREHSASEPFLMVAAPLCLPHLVQLTALFHRATHLATSFFTHLSAPLTGLSLSEGLIKRSYRIPDCMPAAQQLLHSLAAFTQLRSFCAALHVDDSDCSSVPSAPISLLPHPFTALSLLRELILVADPAAVQCLVPALAETATSLTQLRLSVHLFEVSRDSRRPTSAIAAAPAAWPRFFSAFGPGLAELQHVDVTFRVHLGELPSGVGLAALHRLTQLTALITRGWACLNGPGDGEALEGMTRLQQLCLDNIGDGFRVPHECIASMQALRALTSLTLKTSPVDDRLVDGLVEHLPPQSLPALQELTVSLCCYGAAEALAEYAGGVPSLQTLKVNLLASPLLKEHAYDGGSEDELHELEEDIDEAEACLRRAGSDTSLQVSVCRKHIMYTLCR